jgi:2-iminoacetate synthase ThiH
MYTIFNYIDSILYTKKYIDDISDTDSDFSVYMLNRWISMYSPELAETVGKYTNINLSNICNTKQEQYDFLFYSIPRVRRKRIEYIKKTKEVKEKISADIDFIAKQLQLSKREVVESLKIIEEMN